MPEQIRTEWTEHTSDVEEMHCRCGETLSFSSGLFTPLTDAFDSEGHTVRVAPRWSLVCPNCFHGHFKNATTLESARTLDRADALRERGATEISMGWCDACGWDDGVLYDQLIAAGKTVVPVPTLKHSHATVNPMPLNYGGFRMPGEKQPWTIFELRAFFYGVLAGTFGIGIATIIAMHFLRK